MSLKHALLGFLNMWALTGYDLAKMFGATVEFFWSATHTQIYRTLNQMLEDGLLDQEIVAQTNSPNKKLYHITAKGRQELMSWLAEPAAIPPLRHPLLVKVTLADGLSTGSLRSVLEDYREKLQGRLELYRTRNREITNRYARSERERFLWDAVLDNGIALYEGELRWIEETLSGLERFREKEPE
jgi:PadR family transcriptional regulator AphA